MAHDKERPEKRPRPGRESPEEDEEVRCNRFFFSFIDRLRGVFTLTQVEIEEGDREHVTSPPPPQSMQVEITAPPATAEKKEEPKAAETAQSEPTPMST